MRRSLHDVTSRFSEYNSIVQLYCTARNYVHCSAAAVLSVVCDLQHYQLQGSYYYSWEDQSCGRLYWMVLELALNVFIPFIQLS